MWKDFLLFFEVRIEIQILSKIFFSLHQKPINLPSNTFVYFIINQTLFLDGKSEYAYSV